MAPSLEPTKSNLSPPQFDGTEFRAEGTSLVFVAYKEPMTSINMQISGQSSQTTLAYGFRALRYWYWVFGKGLLGRVNTCR